MSGFRVSCLAYRFAMPTDACRIGSFAQGKSWKWSLMRRQGRAHWGGTVHISKCPDHAGLCRSDPCYPPVFCMLFCLSSMLISPPSNMVPLGSSAEHPTINLLQAQNILLNMKFHGCLGHSPPSQCEDAVTMDLRIVGGAGCSPALMWGAQSGGVIRDPHLTFPCLLCVYGEQLQKQNLDSLEKSISLKTQLNNGLLACKVL